MELKHLSDQALLDLYKSGNSNAFELLVCRHQKKLYNYITMMVRNTELAEDIFQETFVKVIKSIKEGNYYDDGKFFYWICRIAHNLIIDHFRKNKKIREISTDVPDMPLLNLINISDNSIEEKLVSRQRYKDIRELLDYLPIEQREVVIMRIYLNMSFKEIAKQTGVGINTALGRMRYAIINLRKFILNQEKEKNHLP